MTKEYKDKKLCKKWREVVNDSLEDLKNEKRNNNQCK